jgi:glycosyltransferase involved in cell wall biosynthesis
VKLGICAYPLSRGKETGRGLERVIQEFCAWLAAKGIPFDFYDSGVIHSEIKAIVLSLGYLARLRKTRCDCYFAVYAVSGIFPAILRKKPLVTVITDLIPFHVSGYDNSLKYAIKRWCARFSCARSDLLIVGSASIRNEIISRFHVDPDKITVVPWGLDHATYYPDMSVAKIENRVAFLGEAKLAKGIDSVIRAFKFVRDEVAEATLVIGGGGRDLEEMKQLAAQTLPKGSYSFSGFVPEEKMNEFYNEADLFVFPSRYGFGLSALEAMACGTPAVVGNTLDAKDFFLDEALLADPDDDREIAQKLIALLRDKDEKVKKAIEAVDFARQFSWEKMSEKYLSACLGAIEAKQPGGRQ